MSASIAEGWVSESGKAEKGGEVRTVTDGFVGGAEGGELCEGACVGLCDLDVLRDVLVATVCVVYEVVGALVNRIW